MQNFQHCPEELDSIVLQQTLPLHAGKFLHGVRQKDKNSADTEHLYAPISATYMSANDEILRAPYNMEDLLGSLI